jgi:hypothetical protein
MSSNLASHHKKCSHCKSTLAVTSFPYSAVTGKTSSRTATCTSCVAKQKESRRKRNANKENSNPNDQGPELDEKTDQTPLTNLSLKDFLLILEQQENTVTLEANVKIDGLLGGRKEQADSLAKLAWEKMN